VKIKMKYSLREPAIRNAVILVAALAVIAIIIGVAGCGTTSSTVPTQVKASASRIAHGIATGQAAQQAEGIVRKCATTRTGWLNIIACIAPHAPKGVHRKAFEHCGKLAIVADIPGQETKLVQTDLPNCLVANR
jgi:hypothetical protein